ncbi:hypothetical protein SAICODRAFT_26201 [Saitoella complicata NRRL Y-17804]|uniref:uncharacterized protein n=1 Tax=Saitoella complicata (strain BCRC 22490 / CBS 7301 / JCM 7358 / NBRC 10748 / NRRL Y-17804) TaxID=698492 RepID=UPI000867E9EE|nr:uncharacterized protein SAICODRAFT_26201 [Saitoella complicata NRRL Y-17804]ODQ52141.1 hypothetical protein SAICODRAFT_26201 [Saitoella complicata NRRL Y-17804]
MSINTIQCLSKSGDSVQGNIDRGRGHTSIEGADNQACEVGHTRQQMESAPLSPTPSLLRRRFGSPVGEDVDVYGEEPMLSPTTAGTEVDPLLTSSSLDQIPVYALTHSIRQEIIAAIDTSLTWDQLRSPQINQFLVRPILQRCQDRCSRAIVFALLINKAQFEEEAVRTEVKSGVLGTRGRVCELVAIKILKTFRPRELIDILTFDFYPLQGHVATTSFAPVQRFSALEIAIRGEAKQFLSTPLVVQVLREIWAGNLVFHSHTDRTSTLNNSSWYYRKVAAVYDMREASLFKLSRLRVPKYRFLMQTASFACMLGLYIAVLWQRSLETSTLEWVMIAWSLGFMLDEVVGISEVWTAGSLYLLQMWNLFDLCILALFVAFLSLRLYGLHQGDPDHKIAETAYDLLATNAIFLFPRLFNALDHVKYFSRMLISFRRMAKNLVTSMLLIFMFYSGFWVAFSVYARDFNPPKTVAFQLMQIFFGFQLPAWQTIGNYHMLGKVVLLIFVATSNFLVVTIFVSVLSNTFSSVYHNADEEHQFLFAVNTTSSVKSEAVFIYQSPLNLLEWSIRPLALFMSRYRFIRMNRLLIKVTHFPILLTIYLNERFYLRPQAFDLKDLMLSRTRSIETLTNGFEESQQRARRGLGNRQSRVFSGMSKVVGRLRKGSMGGVQEREDLLREVFRKNDKNVNSILVGPNGPSTYIGPRASLLFREPLSPPVEGHGRNRSYFGGPARRPQSQARESMEIRQPSNSDTISSSVPASDTDGQVDSDMEDEQLDVHTPLQPSYMASSPFPNGWNHRKRDSAATIRRIVPLANNNTESMVFVGEPRDRVVSTTSVRFAEGENKQRRPQHTHAATDSLLPTSAVTAADSVEQSERRSSAPDVSVFLQEPRPTDNTVPRSVVVDEWKAMDARMDRLEALMGAVAEELRLLRLERGVDKA